MGFPMPNLKKGESLSITDVDKEFRTEPRKRQ